MVSSKIQLKDMFWNPNIFFKDSALGGDDYRIAIERRVLQMRKKKKIKMDTTRVSVTLPVLMVNDFREKADLAGMSLSRIIHLRLRSKSPITIVSNRLVEEAARLRKAMERVAATGGLNSEAVACLWNEVHYYEAWIPENNGGNIYVP